jgi:membrane-associated phospholipid phosphatase
MRGLGYRGVIAAVFVVCGVVAPLRAQTDGEEPPPLFAPTIHFGQVIPQPAGPPPTPRHTGIKAMLKGLVIDLKHLPSRENLFWAGVGGGLALAVHPLDDNVNETLVGNTTAENVFRPGAVLGQFGTLMGSASAVYAVGRLKDQPRVSHVGMDLIQSLLISEGLAQTLKYATKRERPDHSSRKSFPSGHASDTFAFATALERHLGWRYAVPAYAFSSYVAISRLPANRHWFSDVVFGAAVGIVAGRTVTSHEAHQFPVAVTRVPGGAAVMYVYRSK